MDTPTCDRCGEPAFTRKTSVYTLDSICLTCAYEERQLPSWHQARLASIDAEDSGCVGFSGVGLNHIDREDLARLRAKRPTKFYRCPAVPGLPAAVDPDIIGCGTVFSAEVDREGLVDCPACGIWFSPAREPQTVVTR